MVYCTGVYYGVHTAVYGELAVVLSVTPPFCCHAEGPVYYRKAGTDESDM